MSTPNNYRPEFSRMIDLRQINDNIVVLEPDEDERRRMAARFSISAIESMRAALHLNADGTSVDATGRLTARIVQACSISGEDFPVAIDEQVAMRFVHPATSFSPDEEVELDADACDEIEYEGTAFDLGEAIAQTLALAIDPFAEGPEADRARAEHKLGGDVTTGPFAALSAFKSKD